MADIIEPLLRLKETLLHHPDGAKEIARSIHVPYSTLLRELNPNDGGAKVGVDRFYYCMKATGDFSPLESLANMCGFTLTLKDKV